MIEAKCSVCGNHTACESYELPDGSSYFYICPICFENRHLDRALGTETAVFNPLDEKFYKVEELRKFVGSLPDTPRQAAWEEIVAETTSDGSTAAYYELPPESKELQDLISYRDMNGQIAEIFRACYRYGRASHSDLLRDAKKIQFYANAEVARLEKYGS